MREQEGDPSMTECHDEQLEFHAPGRRVVTGRFAVDAISSDGGALSPRQVKAKTRILARKAEEFTDHRDPEVSEHSVRELIGQRILRLAVRYEDSNDHDRLRHDPLLAAAVGKRDPEGRERLREQDRGKALAISSTFNHLELTPADTDGEARYKKIVADPAGLDALLVDCFLGAHDSPPETLWLHLDTTDDPVHGNQEGRFFQGYYGHYCYLPLYIFCGGHPLCARLRPANTDAAKGSVEEVARIVTRIRARWPQAPIIARGDSGFCRDDLMRWCKANGVDFVLGPAKNERNLRAGPAYAGAP